MSFARIRVILLLLNLLPFLLVPLLWPWSGAWAILLFLPPHLVLLYAIFYPSCQWLGPVQTRFQPAEPNQVWLTIDDGPSPQTPEILQLLDQYQATATFFLIGKNAKKFPEHVKAIQAAGHEIANHTQNHRSAFFWLLPQGYVQAEIQTASHTLKSLTGTVPRRFRPPVGMKNPFIHPVLEWENLPCIGWSARGFDTIISSPKKILRRILPDLSPGAIILLHEGRPHSLLTLHALLQTLQSQQLKTTIPTIPDTESEKYPPD